MKLELKEPTRYRNVKAVLKVDGRGRVVATFTSIRNACENEGITRRQMDWLLKEGKERNGYTFCLKQSDAGQQAEAKTKPIKFDHFHHRAYS